VILTLSRGADVLPLTGGLVVGPGVDGLDTPPVAFGEIEPADIDGAFVTNVRYKPRVIDLVVDLFADSAQEARGLTRSLARLLNPQVGQVTLRVEHDAENASQLVPNAASAGDSSQWAPVSTASVLSTVTSPVKTAPNALRVDLVDGGVLGGEAYLGAKLPANMPVIPGQEYRAAAWFRRFGTGSNIEVRLLVRFFDSAGVEIPGSPPPGIAPIQPPSFASASKSVGSTYEELVLSVVAPFGAATANIEPAGGVTASTSFYVDNITFTGVNISREISGYLSEPIGAAPLLPGENLGWRRLGLQLRCPDPMFRAPAQVIEVPNLGDEPVVVDNIGDAVAYPIWTALVATQFPATITLNGGPAIKLKDTAGLYMINTDPRNLSVVAAGGVPAWDLLTTDSVLFSLPPGRSAISGTGVGFGITQVSGSFQTRWLTAW